MIYIVTINYINRLLGKYEHVGYCKGKIFEDLGNSTEADAIVIKLTLNINNYSFIAYFCVVDRDISYFDLLIGLKTIKNNLLFIHLIIM